MSQRILKPVDRGCWTNSRQKQQGRRHWANPTEDPGKADNSTAKPFALFHKGEQSSDWRGQDVWEEMEAPNRHREYERLWPCWASQGSRPEEHILGGHGDCRDDEIPLVILEKHEEWERFQNPEPQTRQMSSFSKERHFDFSKLNLMSISYDPLVWIIKCVWEAWSQQDFPKEKSNQIDFFCDCITKLLKDCDGYCLTKPIFLEGFFFSSLFEMLLYFFLAFKKIRQKNVGQMMAWLTGF